jgi:arylsulfatase A-like enzyme
MPHRANLVIFMPDQLRAESIGCYGHPLVQTPNIDRLAAEGIRFENCFTQSPLCSPARCAMLTGWYPHVAGHRTVDHLLSPREPNLFKYLKASGYDVYWYGSNDVLAHERFGDSAAEWGFFAEAPEWKGAGNPWPFEDPRFYSFLYGEAGDAAQIPDSRRVERAIRVLTERRSPRPFCIFLPLFYPHPPFTAPAEFYGKYDPADLPPLRPPGENKPLFHELIRRSRRLDELDASLLRSNNAVYLGMVSFSDQLLGRLLDTVDESGHREDTAVVFCSDHGEWAGDYGLVEKWSNAMEDPLLRVPLIVRAPGGAQGHEVPEIVELIDLFATVMDLAGVEPQHTHFGRTLMPQIHGAAGDPERAAFAEGGYDATEPQAFAPARDFPTEHIYYPKIHLEASLPETITRTAMIRTRELKLVYRPSGTSELYDLAADPRELCNVHGRREYSGRQQELMVRLLENFVRTSDVIPPSLVDQRSMPPTTTR